MRYRWDPVYPAGRRPGTATPDAAIRASDAERNEVAERLSRHFADGRLDQAEFKARVDRAVGATTRGDLGGLFDDLPPLAEDPAPAPDRRHRRTTSVVIGAAVALLVLAAVASLPGGPFFPFVHVPWLLLVVVGVLFWRRSVRHAHHHHHHDQYHP